MAVLKKVEDPVTHVSWYTHPIGARTGYIRLDACVHVCILMSAVPSPIPTAMRYTYDPCFHTFTHDWAHRLYMYICIFFTRARTSVFAQLKRAWCGRAHADISRREHWNAMTQNTRAPLIHSRGGNTHEYTSTLQTLYCTLCLYCRDVHLVTHPR